MDQNITLNLSEVSSFKAKAKLTLKTMSPERSFYFFLGIYLSLFLLIILLFVFVRNNFVTSVPKTNTTMNVASFDNVKYFLPFHATNDSERIISSLIFTSLKKKIDSNNYANELILDSNFDIENKKLNIRINPNARFENGDLITTDDIIYSYTLASDIRVDSVERAKYEGMEFTKVSDSEFIIDFKKSYSNMDELLTLGIVNKKDIENESPDAILLSEKNQKPIGSGIYKIKEVLKDSGGINSITLSYNNYNENIPNHRKIIFKFYDDEATLASDNDANMYDLVLIDKYNKVDYTNYKYITPRITALFLNPNKSQIFGKKEVRKSLYANIDRNYITKNILSAGATSTYDLFPASSSSTPLINSLPPSLSNASGSQTQIALTYLDNKRNDDLAIYLVARASELGLNLVANPVNQEEIQSAIKNRNFDVLLYTIQIEDLASLYAFWHSSQKNAPGLNITNYVSKGFDENLEKLRYSDNPDEIQAAKEAMLTEFYDEYPYIPLYTAFKNIAVKSNNEIQIDEYVSNPKYLFNNISAWNNQKEYIYNFLEKYIDKIKKISKLIY